MKRLYATLCFIAAFFITPVFAVDYTWTGAARDGNYANPNNWASGSIPASASDTVVYFPKDAAGTIRLAAFSVNVEKLVFQNTSSAYTFEGGGASLNILSNITLSGGDVTFRNVSFSNDTITVNGAGRLLIDSPAVPSGGGRVTRTLTITGNSTVLVSGSTMLSRGLNVDKATVILNSNSAVSGGQIKISSGGYVGYTQNFATKFSDFLTQIQAITDPNAIVGIDSTTPTVNRTVSDLIDLRYFNTTIAQSPFYLGTSSKITLTGLITPTTNVTGGPNALYLTAINGGYLNVTSSLAPNASPVGSVVIGQPYSVQPNPGTVELSGNNTYSGGTRVLGGTLQINGYNNLGSGAVEVGSGATLSLGTSGDINNAVYFAPGSTASGSGIFEKPITIGADVNLVPGGYGGFGTMHFHGGLTLDGGARLHIDLASSRQDYLCVHDSLTIAAGSSNPIMVYLYSYGANELPGSYVKFDATKSYTWTLVYNAAYEPLAITGLNPSAFMVDASNFISWNPTAATGVFNITEVTDGLNITFTPVPEPSTYALLALGLGALAVFEIRRRKK